MQFLSSRYFFRLIPILACLGLLALFIHLGLWQAGKAERGQAQKALYEARSNNPPLVIGTDLVDPEILTYASVAVRGEYEAAAQFYVDNQIEDGRPGVHVITPLKIAGGDTRILVNRGWASWTDRRFPPRVNVPNGEVEITGIAVLPVKQKYLLMPERQEAWPELWPMLDLERYFKENAYPVQPVVVYTTLPDQGEGLIRKIPQPEDKIMMHKGYAMQWFGMATALLVFCFVVGFKKWRKNTKRSVED